MHLRSAFSTAANPESWCGALIDRDTWGMVPLTDYIWVKGCPVGVCQACLALAEVGVVEEEAEELPF